MGKLTTIGRTLMVLMPAGLVEKLNPKRSIYRGEMIDAKADAMGKLVRHMREKDGIPTVEEGRKMLRDIAAKLDVKVEVAKIEDMSVQGAAGPLEARLYTDNPSAEGPQPAMLYFHGGGFMQGDLESHHHTCCKLAKWWGGVVISVNYRHAPEDPFPAAPEDCEAAFCDVVERAEELGLDPSRIGVGGDSAGGNLSAVTAQQLAGKDGPKVAFQVLIYPVLDATLSNPSITEHGADYMLPPEMLSWFLDSYTADWKDVKDPRMSPMFGENIDKLPKTYILTAGFDPLINDGEIYTEKLQNAGVDVTYRNYPGQIHGFVNMTKVVPQGLDALQEIAAWLKNNA